MMPQKSRKAKNVPYSVIRREASITTYEQERVQKYEKRLPIG
jgi:hypothetical protein